MKNPKLFLPKPDEKVPLPFDRERPFVKILSFETDLPEEELKKIMISFQREIQYSDGRGTWGTFTSSSFWKPTTLDMRNAKGLKLAYFIQGKVDLDFQVWVEYTLMDKLDTKIPTVGFNEHLENPRNIKILFSAPFGQGKTTFLNQYFDERIDQYNVFKLYPVNYAVASNQDIFRYIKSDILLQLLERTDIAFEKVTLGYGESFYRFFKKHPERVIAPFLKMIPKIGKNLHGIYNELIKLQEAFFKYHDKAKLDEAELANNFVKCLIEEEGSLYEDNFYTQLIRNLLLQLKENDPKKETILIIDDLDRMDPDHIFRILNVLSAHYDLYHNNPQEENNKFGFDRIILVADYNNIKNIYEYRYGPKVDFGGYFNKYFSTESFGFDNSGVYGPLINNIDQVDESLIRSYGDHHYWFVELAYALVNNGVLTLRELLKLREISFRQTIAQIKNPGIHGVNLWFRYGVFSPVVAFFSKLGDPVLLRQKLEKIDLQQTFNRIKNFNEPCLQLYAALLNGDTEGNLVYLKSNYRINFTLKMDTDFEYSVLSENFIQDLRTENKLKSNAHIFTKSDFMELLLANVDYFNSIKDRI